MTRTTHMNPAARAWLDRLGIPATPASRKPYVYAIEPALDNADTDAVESPLSPIKE